MSKRPTESSTPESSTLDFLRHGEPVGGKRFRGSTDDPLSENGWQQMRQSVGSFSNWDVIISSPLLRCQAYAQKLAQGLNIPLQVEPLFQEIHFGQWEGLSVEDVMRDYPGKLYEFWRDDDAYTPPQAEKISDFCARIDKAIDTVKQQFATKHCLIVAHSGVIHAALAKFLQRPLQSSFDIEVPYGCATRFKLYNDTQYGESATLIFHNARLDQPD